MPSYKSQYAATVDERGRIAVPAKFRGARARKGDEKFVLTRGLDKCLSLYPNLMWKKIEKMMSDIPFSGRDRRYFERMLNSFAVTVAPDKQGRILVPAFLLKLADIHKDVLVIGVSSRIELWNPIHWDRYMAEFDKSFEDVVETLRDKAEL